MSKHIVLIQGHPDPDEGHFCNALAATYAQGAQEGEHEVRRISIAKIDFPIVRTKKDWETELPPSPVRHAQETILWAQHLVVVYPLWLGGMPALVKGFFEQVFRPEFGSQEGSRRSIFARPLRGRTAHIVVTMGMPALVYRWYFGAHSLKSFEQNILRFIGIRPVRESLIGTVEGKARRRERWLAKMQAFGKLGV
jgi:putative NADPH-quinone reductase